MNPQRLEGLVRDIFVAAGMSAEHARLVAEVLVWADLRGMGSHGVMRVPRYVDLIRAGDLNPNPVMTTRNETAACVLLEADRAAGPVAMTHATQLALSKAKEAGAGICLVRATTHTAALGYYTHMAANAGMAAIAFSGSWPNMAYTALALQACRLPRLPSRYPAKVRRSHSTWHRALFRWASSCRRAAPAKSWSPGWRSTRTETQRRILAQPQCRCLWAAQRAPAWHY